MISRTLQDWTTMRGASGAITITQSESEWLDVAQYQDATFWLLLRDFNSGGASPLNLLYQTAPIKDERLFVNLASVSLAMSSLSTPTTTAILTSRFTTNTSVGLGAWLRWTLSATGATSSWDVTFRVDVSLNKLMSFPPRSGAALRAGDAQQGGR